LGYYSVWQIFGRGSSHLTQKHVA